MTSYTPYIVLFVRVLQNMHQCMISKQAVICIMHITACLLIIVCKIVITFAVNLCHVVQA